VATFIELLQDVPRVVPGALSPGAGGSRSRAATPARD
jgi:hypothetical protein